MTSLITKALLEAEDVLRLLRGEGEIPYQRAMTADQVAKALGKDPSNTRRGLNSWVKAELLNTELDGGVTVYRCSAEGIAGLEALDRANGVGVEVAGLPTWPLDKIVENPANPRKTVAAEPLELFAETIVTAKGLLQPIVLYPADANGVRMLHAGTRRTLACRLLAGEDRLPEALAHGLPYIEREGTLAEALLVGLIENGQREDLTPWEEAQALKAYQTETQLSARAIAFATGRAKEGKEKGVRDVQVKIKVATEATQANIALHESGLWTWEQLRDSVSVSAPPAADPEPAEPTQTDIEDPGPWSRDVDHEEWVRRKLLHALCKISPRNLLALVELADACHWRPAPDGLHEAATLVWKNHLGASMPQDLVSEYGCGSASGGGKPHTAHVHPVTMKWLEDRGLLTSGANRADILYQVRQAVSQAAADRCKRTGLYHSEWLNPPDATEDTPEKPSRLGQTSFDLMSPDLLLVLAEAVTRFQSDEGTHPDMSRAVILTAHYPNDLDRQLRRFGVGAIVTEPRSDGSHLVNTYLTFTDRALQALVQRNARSIVHARELAGLPPLMFDGALSPSLYHNAFLRWPPADRLPDADSPERTAIVETARERAQEAIARADADAQRAVTPRMAEVRSELAAAHTAASSREDRDEEDDDEALTTLIDLLRENLSQSLGTAARWNDPDLSLSELASLAINQVLRLDVVDAMVSLMGLLQRAGDGFEATKILHAAVEGPNRPEGQDPASKLYRAGRAVQDFMVKNYDELHALPDAEHLYRDLAGALTDLSYAKKNGPLLVLNRGDVVEKYPGGATAHRLLERAESDGPRIVFRAQPIRHGKDYGKPAALALTEIAAFARANTHTTKGEDHAAA
ncbi:ParB N-terminal domain-containing protein [Caulobacter vibrioides]|uniref:ParB N-terminal domain-containing protein n=1 Tax=Caulobacter vibrioides TaxID=155892 RepID=UPI000BB4D358|nr:ParB N-terminal domain-containing protein [Caulobacter vibrioides]ATC25185.1 hypothetical protein CA608_11935 [Caulobacter vibrioides]PLR13956.1 hypothetical protein CVUC_05240 [Caulobacter vibrioides]